MKVGYQRVSTQMQELARQTRAFEELGITKIFTDKASGKNAEREQLKAMLNYIREDDIVVVESISRIARNTKDLLNIIDIITAKGADFVSLKGSAFCKELEKGLRLPKNRTNTKASQR